MFVLQVHHRRRPLVAAQPQDKGGILDWFEAYADALDSGYYKVIAMCKARWFITNRFEYPLNVEFTA